MIIVNGTMQIVLHRSTAQFDEHGNPLPIEKRLSEPIPVNISGNMARDTRTAQGTSYTQASYEVLCDDTTFNAEEVQLQNSRGKNLGIFRVRDVQYLDYVDCVKIIAERYGTE